MFCFEPFYGQSCAEPTPQARSATRFSSPSKEKPTQFFLKQPWEQKKLSFMPNPKQVGHCKASALLSQSTPRHFLFERSSGVMLTIVEYSDQMDSWSEGGGKGRAVGGGDREVWSGFYCYRTSFTLLEGS